MAKILGWRKGIDKKKGSRQELSPEQPLNIETITWGDLTWVDVVLPAEREKQWLADTYQFHPLALDDCLSRKQIPKGDVYPGYLFFIFHYPIYAKEPGIGS